ncbi:TIR domain-containing protein [Bacillus sp. OV166]|uniref:toll/interleukin-1 receptor domain-containing protein n=1 Tax=Bacillus sp. OV166 TaxID=1882763 RepID=UPI000A2AD409|nr:toll/interleukin-1 receptor domain-containing protein [Bacillus sp. OV166]SMQ77555.1 TIR domain-containing protein [Bacillus sp. OV166]
MARIFLSHSSKDWETAKKISDGLKSFKHEIVVEPEEIPPGENWREFLFTSLMESDGVVVIYTENTANSQYVMSEIGTSRAFIRASNNKKFLIPVVIGNIGIPDVVSDIFCITTLDEDESDLSKTIEKLNDVISIHEVKVAAQIEKENLEKVEKEEIIDRMRKNPTILETIKRLEKREIESRSLAFTCYFISLIALLSGILFTYSNVLNIQHDKAMYYYITLGAKSLVVIGLITAISRYGFTLGKAFMNEASKHENRLHSINYGLFFIGSFKAQLTYDEMKDIFLHWKNIGSNGDFIINPADQQTVVSETLSQTSQALEQLTKLTDTVKKLVVK